MDNVTIQDVAKHANVGISTVSKVLNDYKGVAKATQQRVLEAVKELNYRPNRAARSFRTGRTQTASVFLPMIGTEFYDQLITAIDNELAEHDYDAALFPLLNERRLERYRSPDALPYQADGIILASLNPDWLFLDAKLPAQLPAVLVDAYHADYDTVTVDNAGGAYAATKHLLEKPGTTFALMIEKYDDIPFSSGVFLERLKGFKRALADSGQSFEEGQLITVEFSGEGGRDGLRNILARTVPPINIFASCDLLAKGVMEEAKVNGLALGKDVRVVGFDAQPWTKDYGLSTVKQPIEQLGKEAIRLFLKRLDDPERNIVHHEFKPELIVRSSS